MNPETVNPEHEPAVHRLPPELLLSIFKLASPPTGINIHPSAIRDQAPWKVGRVCRRWRNIIENSPELWSPLVLDRESLPDSAEAPFWQHFAEIFDVLSNRSAGCQHLELRLVDTATSDNRNDVVGRIISRSFLACLFNRQIDIQPVIPWERITVFHLSKYRLEYLYEVLRKCDNLQELILGERHVGAYYDSIAGWGSGLRLDSLRTLKFVVHGAAEDSRVLQILTLPTLERLEIVLKARAPEHGKMVFDVEPILEMLGRSGCTLKALSIRNLRYQIYALGRFLKYAACLEELVLEGDVSRFVIKEFAAKLDGLEKLAIRCTPCTRSGAGLPPPVDSILGAVRGMPRLRSLEVQARVPRHMWRTVAQVDELRSRDIDELSVIDNVVTLLRDRSMFPVEAFKILPHPQKDPDYTQLEHFWDEVSGLPGTTRDKIRQLLEEWPKEGALNRPFNFGHDGLTFPYVSPFADFEIPREAGRNGWRIVGLDVNSI
ncbi:hypothetical protein VNI00_018834 [Paramarasmius palmivorus]|uniref:F-box domain-containing protein n=1 Tax=Paramarasmius palmivorus TaxID=297713 RepID=A0AAW0AX55_9AGAR